MKIWIGISTKVYQGYTCISTLYCYTYTFSVYQHPFFVLSTHTPILYMIFRVMIMIVKVYRPPISWYTANHPIAGANVHWELIVIPHIHPFVFRSGICWICLWETNKLKHHRSFTSTPNRPAANHFWIFSVLLGLRCFCMKLSPDSPIQHVSPGLTPTPQKDTGDTIV